MTKGTFEVTNSGFRPADADGLKIHRKLECGTFVELDYKDPNRGSQSMLNTWMMWMGQTAAFMAAKGCTMPLYIDSKGNHHGSRPFDKNDCHALFTMTYLGSDEHDRRKSWSRTKNASEVQASMEDRLWAMEQHIVFCAERGIQITIPRDSEFEEERKKLQRQVA